MGIDRKAAFRAIASGKTAEESPAPYLVSAWQHLIGHEYGADDFAQATIDFVKTWDWEWVKINPRAIYYSEAWGATYDHNDYQNGYVIPRTVSTVIKSAADVESIERLDPSANPVLREQIDAARLIRAGLGDRAVIDTVFSPLSVLLQFADLPLYPGDPYARPTIELGELFEECPEQTEKALKAIAETLADYAATLVRDPKDGGAGLDGIFYAVTGTASENYFDDDAYARFAAPYDRIVIDAIRNANPDAVILLHTCRQESHPERFAHVGADILHWDQFLEGNPDINAPLGPVPVGGASYTLFAPDGDAAKAAEELRKTIELRRGKPFLLAPSCTVPTPASDASLRALSEARAAR